MPPKAKITREEILQGALELLRTDPQGTWNARALASWLGISTQPIFSHFSGMEELKKSAIELAQVLFEKRLREETDAGKYPAYKASGMAYIRFAREEPHLFRLLFMRDRSGEAQKEDFLTEEIYTTVQKQTGLTRDEAKLFHLEMWSCVHGLATMLATGFLSLKEEQISTVLTDLYQGLIMKDKGEVR